MIARIILFRGMNIGGVRAPVADQRAMALDLGLANPRTLLASGNLVVESDRSPADLETALQAETERRFGRRIDAVVRTPGQWAAMMVSNPFVTEARRDPARLLVMVMKDAIRPGAVEALGALAQGQEAVRAAGGSLWFWHPDGIGGSKMAARAVPRLTGPGTGRNWNTVCKLAEMAGLPGSRQ